MQCAPLEMNEDGGYVHQATYKFLGSLVRPNGLSGLPIPGVVQQQVIYQR